MSYRKTRKTIESRLSLFREHYKVDTRLNVDHDGKYKRYQLNIRNEDQKEWTALTNYIITDNIIEVINALIHVMEFIKNEKPLYPPESR
jgi:hypothetical protein